MGSPSVNIDDIMVRCSSISNMSAYYLSFGSLDIGDIFLLRLVAVSKFKVFKVIHCLSFVEKVFYKEVFSH